MMNDLVIETKADKKEMRHAQDLGLVVTQKMRDSATKVAIILQHCPNSILIGPGCAKQWKMSEDFDTMAQVMMDIFYSHGVSSLNIVDQVAQMENATVSTSTIRTRTR